MKKIFYIFVTLAFSLNILADTSCSTAISNLINYKNVDLNIPREGINDVVARLRRYYPSGIALPETEEEIASIVKLSRESGVPVSIKAGGFSQGGQWAIEKGIIIDISKFKGFKVNNARLDNPSITVRPGSTWREIQKEINELGLAITVQQSSNIFTVGGALGINSHGRDISYGQIINVVNWIKVLRPDGSIVKASKTENVDIFKEVIGGLGLRGIILEANIKLRKNKLLETVVLKDVPKDEVSRVFNLMRENPRLLKSYISKKDLGRLSINFDEVTPDMIEMGYGRSQNINPNRVNYMNEALMYLFVEVPWENSNDPNVLDLITEKSITDKILPYLMEAQRLSHSMKSVREFIEKNFMRKTGDQITLNNLMNPPVDFLLFKKKEDALAESNVFGRGLIYLKNILRKALGGKFDSTDVLKEYFIPMENAASFENSLESIIKKYNLNNLNNTYRLVPESEVKPVVNYAKEDMISFVLNFNVSRDKESLENVKQWSSEMARAAYDHGGVHYLAYGASVDTKQLILSYPGLIKIFDAMIDDKNMFGNVVFNNAYIEPYFKEYTKNPEFFKGLNSL